jgi:hypothetical protein
VNDRDSLTKWILIVIAALGVATPRVDAHPDHSIGESTWLFGRDSIVVRLELSRSMLARVPGLTAGASGIRREALQRYLDGTLSIVVNERTYRATVTRVAQGHDPSVVSISLAAEGISFDRPLNTVTLDYRLLFEETRHVHLNAASIYRSAAEPPSLEQARLIQQFTFAHDATALELSIAQCPKESPCP